MSTDHLYVGNDNYMELQGLTNPISGAVVTDAAVAGSIYTSAGQMLAGPVALPHASSGDYRALVEGLALVHGDNYRIVISAEASGLSAQWDVWRRAIKRSK